MYLTGFPARVSAVPHAISAIKAFFVLGGFLLGLMVFFPLKQHQAFVSTYLSASQTLGQIYCCLVPFDHQYVMTQIWSLNHCFLEIVQPTCLIPPRLSGFSMCSFPFGQSSMTSTFPLHFPVLLSPWLFAIPFPSFESLCHKVSHKVVFSNT